MWTSEVPEDSELPYCAVMHEGTAYEHMMSGSKMSWVEYARVSFHVYASGAEAAEDLAELLIDTYAGGSNVLQMVNKTVEAVLPDGMSVTSESVRYKDGNLVFRGLVYFDIRISKG